MALVTIVSPLPKSKISPILATEAAAAPDVVGEGKRTLFRERERNRLDIGTACVVFAVHCLCLFAPFHINWSAFWVAFALYVITGLLGITLCFHRNLAHRSFKLPKWLEYSFAYCGLQGFQGSPMDWVSVHRAHHQFGDSERDPHSPIEGFWYSHMIWLLYRKSITKRCGESNNVGDLKKQLFYRFIQRTYNLQAIALGVLLYALGGFPFLVWGMIRNNQSSILALSKCMALTHARN